jgi:dipeptidyl aminopeptidase/acylaminoacyl peptidase
MATETTPHPHSPTEPGQPLTFEQVVSWQRPSDVQLSPDGSWVAFVLKPLSKTDEHPTGAIWLVPFATDAGEARQFTGGQWLDEAPRWSPDGTRLAFLSDRAERGKMSLYVVPLDGGEAQRFFDEQGELSDPTWSPDGRFIAVLFTEPETEEEKKRKEERDDVHVWDSDYKYRRLWVIDVASREAKVVSPGQRHVQEYAWSPDSAKIAINTTATPRIDDGFYPTDVSIISRDGGASSPVFEPQGVAASLTWSTDGASLVYRGPAGRVMHPDYVYSVPVSGGQPTCLTPDFPGTVEDVRSGDGADLYFVAYEGVDSTIYRLDPSGACARLFSTSRGRISTPLAISADGQRLAVIREDATHAPNVWSSGPSDISHESLIQRTNLNPEIEAAALGQAEVVRWTSDPGVEVEGVLIKPHGYIEGRCYPFVVQVHGGPTGLWSNQFAATWHDWAQSLASRGFAVLMPNPRGSTGRGPEYSNAIFGDVGGGEYRDMMTGVDAMIERGIADPERLGVGGWSWGGYMTAWTVSQTDRFKVAVMGAGLPNLISDNSLGDIPSANLSYFETTPYHDPEPYFERSAIRHIRNAKTPTLILHGEADDRVSPAEGREMYIALRTLGVETQFVTYPRERHSFIERKHQLDLIRRVVEWYERFLGA